MMLLVVLAVTLGLVASSPIQNTPKPTDGGAESAETPARRNMEGGSLNEMLHEVGELIKDTNSMMENTVKELEAEDKISLKNLPPNYHNQSVIETKVGNATIVTKEEIVKETDNKTGSTFIAKTIITSVKNGDKDGHECIVDEDCSPGNYCRLSSVNYRCLPCKEEEMCTRDGECCAGQLCVWGQCRASSKGRTGTICESQQDCGPGLCCALHTSLLFPVCTPLPGKGEHCQTQNPLLEIFTWELEAEVPVNLCPCPSGLVCRPESRSSVSVCEDPSLLHPKRDEDDDEDLSFFTPPPQEDMVYEDGLLLPTDFGLDLSDSEDAIDRESELVPRPPFVDFI